MNDLLRCPICRVGFAVEPSSELWRRCAACEAMVFRPGRQPLILIAHESEEMSQQLGAVLLAEGFSVVRAADGAEALFLHAKARPAATVMDVGLRRINSFEVIERLRRDAEPEAEAAKIVLLASVFNRTAYKRRPTSLYGADDYVEQHHIPDLLPAKLSRLLALNPVAVSPAMHATIERIAAAHERQDLYGARRVRVLAEAIVADIALYNEAELAEAREKGHAAALQGALSEGRRILAELACNEDYPCPDPIEEAFTALLEQRRADRPTVNPE